MFYAHVGQRVLEVCEVCYARVSLLSRKYPDIYKALVESPNPREEHFAFPKVSNSDLFDEIQRLRQLRAGDQPELVGAGSYSESGIPGKLIAPRNEVNRPFDDVTPLHPIPLLGVKKEPDDLPPQVADNPKLCELSARDKLDLHGLGVVWNAGDEKSLPVPAPPREGPEQETGTC
jgi:hypothetical protein